jgi:hypothetical protein
LISTPGYQIDRSPTPSGRLQKHSFKARIYINRAESLELWRTLLKDKRGANREFFKQQHEVAGDRSLDRDKPPARRAKTFIF